jgi:hypothetical protein
VFCESISSRVGERVEIWRSFGYRIWIPDFQNASFGSFREVAAPQACGRNEIETAGSAAGEPPRLKPGTMNAEKRGSARQAQAWKLPEILGGRYERAQKGSRSETELAGTPLRRRQDLR